MGEDTVVLFTIWTKYLSCKYTVVLLAGHKGETRGHHAIGQTRGARLKPRTRQCAAPIFQVMYPIETYTWTDTYNCMRHINFLVFPAPLKSYPGAAMSKNGIEQHGGAQFELQSFPPFVNELDAHRPRWLLHSERSSERKITTKHSFSGIKNQVTVNSK